MKQLFLRCDCHSPEHHLIFSYDEYDFYIEYKVNKLRFIDRLKYLFGIQPWQYDTVQLDDEKLANLEEFIHAFRNENS